MAKLDIGYHRGHAFFPGRLYIGGLDMNTLDLAFANTESPLKFVEAAWLLLVEGGHSGVLDS